MVEQSLIDRIRNVTRTDATNDYDHEDVSGLYKDFMNKIRERETQIKDIMTIATEWKNAGRDMKNFLNEDGRMSFFVNNVFTKLVIGTFIGQLFFVGEEKDGTLGCYYAGSKITSFEECPIYINDLNTFIDGLDVFIYAFMNYVSETLKDEETKQAKENMKDIHSYVNHQCNIAIWNLQKMQQIIQFQYDHGIWIEDFTNPNECSENTYDEIISVCNNIEASYDRMMESIKNTNDFADIYKRLECEESLRCKHQIVPLKGIDWIITLSEKSGEHVHKSDNNPKKDGYYICTVVRSDDTKEIRYLFWRNIKNYWEENGKEVKDLAVLAYTSIEPSDFSNFSVIEDEDIQHCIQ